MYKKSLYAFTLLILSLGVSGCVTSSNSSNAYTRDQARRLQSVRLGTVEAVRAVQIEGTQSGVGAVAGGVAGGVAGSTIGKGSGSTLAALGGAILGAAAGHLAEDELTGEQGLEITVKLDDGSAVAIVQGADEAFSPGERVRIIEGPDGTTRVTRL